MNEGTPCGVFAFIIGDDPTYQVIEDGGWLNDNPYGAIIEDARRQGRLGVVLTCKDALVDYYAGFGFVNEGRSNKSSHGGVDWNQMRLTF